MRASSFRPLLHEDARDRRVVEDERGARRVEAQALRRGGGTLVGDFDDRTFGRETEAAGSGRAVVVFEHVATDVAVDLERLARVVLRRAGLAVRTGELDDPRLDV